MGNSTLFTQELQDSFLPPVPELLQKLIGVSDVTFYHFFWYRLGSQKATPAMIDDGSYGRFKCSKYILPKTAPTT